MRIKFLFGSTLVLTEVTEMRIVRTEKQFTMLFNCPLSAGDYDTVLVSQNVYPKGHVHETTEQEFANMKRTADSIMTKLALDGYVNLVKEETASSLHGTDWEVFAN